MEQFVGRATWAVAAQVVASMSQGVLVLDARGRVEGVNPEASRLLGWTAAQLVGSDMHDTVHQHSHRHLAPSERCALLEAAHTSTSTRSDDDLFVRADGSLLPVSWVADPLAAGTQAGGSAQDEGDIGPVGVVVRFVDVTATRVGQVAEAASREQDRASLVGAQQSVSDLGWIAELTQVMSTTMDEPEALARLSRLVIPRLADICVVDLVDDGGHLHRLSGAVAQGVEVDLDAVLATPEVAHTDDDRATLSTVARQAVTRLDAEAMADPDVLSAPSRRLLSQVGARSMLIVPLAARNRMVGLAGLIRLTDNAYSDADMMLAADVGRRAGLVLDNARLFQAEQRVAERLQQALLPTIGHRQHIDVAARYSPAADRHRVGGDWYDVFACPASAGITQTADEAASRGSQAAHVLVVGDVAGHDLQAATTMAALRNLVRGVAVTGTDGPAATVSLVDAALPVLEINGTATVAVVRAERTASGWTLTWTSAGHPPALLLDPTGRHATLLDAHPDPLLGTRTDPNRHDHVVHAPFGSTLLLYSDGLVEQRREDLDRGFARLRQAAIGDPAPAAVLLDRILTALPASPDDDTVLLITQLL